MDFKYTDGCHPDFIRLCHMLDAYLNDIAGGEANRAEYIPYNQLHDIHDVIIAYDKDVAVGIAGFQKYDARCAELKRVFVREDYRGKGVSKRLLERLETRAKEKGFTHMILESGEPLVEAMGLYRSLGYVVIPNYGPYADMPDSICMRKSL